MISIMNIFKLVYNGFVFLTLIPFVS